MICYRDITFCGFWENCSKGEGCSRVLTEEVIAAAEKWRGSENAPICQYVEEPDCFQSQGV